MNEKKEKDLKKEGFYCYKRSEIKTEDRYLVFISRQPTFPKIQGNRIYMSELLAWFRGEGYKILYLFPCLGCLDSLPSMANSVDDLYVVDESFKRPSSFEKLSKIDHSSNSTRFVLEKILSEYPVEIVLANYAHTASYLQSVPVTSKRIILTHDALYKLAFLPFEIAENRICSYEEEKKLLSFSDMIIAINKTEAEIFQEMFQGSKPVVTVGMAAASFSQTKEEKKINAEENLKIFCAASNNPMNIEGMKDFLKKCWPKISSEIKSVEFRIAGAVCEYLKEFEGMERVSFLGVIADLNHEISQATILLNPTTKGTGLKIKTIESVSYGKAIVSYPSGVDGMVNIEELGIEICTTEEDFTSTVIDLLKNDRRRKWLEEKSRAYTSKYLSHTYVYKELKDFLLVDRAPVAKISFVEKLKKKWECFFPL